MRVYLCFIVCQFPGVIQYLILLVRMPCFGPERSEDMAVFELDSRGHV